MYIPLNLITTSHLTNFSFVLHSANTSKPQFDLAVNEIDILTNETYDPSNSLLVVIHGFKGTSNETTYLRIKDGKSILLHIAQLPPTSKTPN